MDTNNILISLGLYGSDHNMFIVHREITLAVRLLEKVDAFYDFGWWSGVITKNMLIVDTLQGLCF
ncbi:hypothetical protein HanXRQr2_Chr11g0506081 [Helianthus annuus]|uniref:Uncharacterized protein n=1 Tax=Helianthus annuus TaxID=4232 RepID=A0A251TDZ9_HELAN|nr:hypothetical protein HanXRQr2_Chr11g0506081 [Helianthus annuus]KAJ0876377.1 hypothetical protein HanPSC8_Chr11g0487701 [Helianthus annuus]